MIDVSILGLTPDGREVKKFRITNGFGEYTELIEFGATIHSLCIKDRAGNIGDVVCGLPGIENISYRMRGMTIGRCANRIAYGKCTVGGRELQLEVSEKGHFLHGEGGNYGNKLFFGTAGADGKTVTFYFRDTGDGGFGDCADAYVRFTFDDEHRLSINYEITPEKETVLCPTNHAYFNLGDFSDIREHMLRINAENVADKGEIGVPTGPIKPVKGTPVDFTELRKIGEAMESDMSFFSEGRVGYDDFYVVDKRPDGFVAELICPENGRVMRTYSDMQSVILYTPDKCCGVKNKDGVFGVDYAAVCLETQFVPNAVNCPEFESPVFKAGETLSTTTVYEFDVID